MLFSHSLTRSLAPSLLCLLVALASPAPADPGPGSQGPSVPPYVFVPGDVIEINVQPQQGHDRTVTVQPDGKIALPIVGEITAAGLNVAQLAARVEQGLQRELKRPRVTVTLKEINKGLLRRASVWGAVKTAGVFDLKERATVAELIATAGGTLPVADLGRITITRAGGEVRVLDLVAARDGTLSRSVVLEPGDVIFVPEGVAPRVLVLGEVLKPSSYDLQGEMRVLDALSMAGGPSTKADLRRVTLTRLHAGQEQVLDLQDLLTKGRQDNLEANVVLRPGDTIVVPESARKFYVIGEVNKAEAYPLKPNDRLLDAITTAGGTTRDADLTRVVLIRKDEKGQPVGRKLDLRKMMKSGNLASNEPLREGDVLFVPNRRERRPILEYLNFLYPLSGVFSIFRR